MHTIFETDGTLAILTFNRPDARNAMTWEMYQALVDACDRAEAQGTDDARIVASSPRRGMPSWARPPADHADLSRRRVLDGDHPNLV